MAALAGYLMRTANVGTFNAIADLDLSFTQIKVLCALEVEQEQQSAKGLAESLGVSFTTISRAVDGLFERGMVHRQEDANDRRIKRLRLTDSGKAVPQALDAARLSALKEFVASLDEDEAQALEGALALILERRAEVAAYRPAKKGTP
jgi:DNA-binding MarR family transcriptional regulator